MITKEIIVESLAGECFLGKYPVISSMLFVYVAERIRKEEPETVIEAYDLLGLYLEYYMAENLEECLNELLFVLKKGDEQFEEAG